MRKTVKESTGRERLRKCCMSDRRNIYSMGGITPPERGKIMGRKNSDTAQAVQKNTMDEKRLEKLLAMPDRDFNADYRACCPPVVETTDAVPGTEEWADVICQAYAETVSRYERNKSNIPVYQDRIAHARAKCEHDINEDRLRLAKEQMAVDIEYISLFEQAVLQLDESERYVILGRYRDKIKCEDFVSPDTGRKLSTGAFYNLLHSGLQKMADEMLDYFSWLYAACG